MGIRIGVLVSGKGRGSNFQAIADACARRDIDGEVAVLVSLSRDAGALDRAAAAGIDSVFIDPKGMEQDEIDARIDEALESRGVDLVCLAGFMRMLGTGIVSKYRNRMMNIHPALVPMFCGKGFYGIRVHEAAIERGVKYSGVTVHFVDEDYDHGPIVLQKIVEISDEDDAESLAAKVLAEEHRAYAEAIQLFAEGRLKVEGRRVRVAARRREG
jgi:phosphoribosylglycinamide formyltransferase-1